jgi:hypothetical protein
VDVPAFPATEADLAEWAVYADWLLMRGDQRGELITYELSLPAVVTREQRAEFHTHAQRVCRQRDRVKLGFCLGHIRTIDVLRMRVKMGGDDGPDRGTLANVTDLLAGDAARVECLALAWWPGKHPHHIRRLLAALPKSCRRLELHPLANFSVDAVEWLQGTVPAHVREVAFVGGRGFSELRAQPRRAALVDIVRTYRMPIWRWGLIELQSKYGIVPVRAQLTRALAETFQLPRTVASAIGRGFHRNLVCRGDRWTVSSCRSIELWRNEEPVGAEYEPLEHGDLLRFGDATWRFENPV